MTHLAEYRRKRDPAATPEPFGDGDKGIENGPIFVVHRHAARRLHFDFRLERDGVLASWALPKGVPLQPGERRLAVQVEDHPLEYARFEGEIPPGQYGAGTVEIWDSGSYELVREKPDGTLIVRLHGRRLEGTWALVPARVSGEPENWLIIRTRDGGEDKSHEEMQREEPPIPPEIRRGRRVVRLSNLDKLFWPEAGITKGDLLRYYRDVAPVLVPHLRERPFTMKRYPDGWRGKHFFQKDAPKNMPDWIKRVTLVVTPRETGKQRRTIQAPIVNDELALLWMINMGCIDCNTWYSRIDKLDRPDWVVFDLDPSDDVGFAETAEVALLVKHELDALELVSFPKTSGAVGMHVLVPVERRHSYDDTRRFAHTVADTLARKHPGLATTEWSKQRRRGVLIDASQNARGKTIASVYSVRPMPHAPVSTPLRWDEVNEKLDPSSYSMEVVLDRIRRYGDLYGPVLTTKQRLSRAVRRPES
jgi:bifunctional non-homologous end joining protein LigD